MSLATVRQTLIDRLEEADRGDRGWFVTTRVHVAASWLKAISEYLENRGGGEVITLSGHDYRRLATIIETDAADPGLQLKRHHLLAMDKPLQLLRRVIGNEWNRIQLTDRGRDLAITDDPSGVLESSLSDIRFAVEPWSPPSRVTQYDQFDVRAYEATRQVLERCGGFIDRNEFDFFVSRIRTFDEVDWAVAAISEYRQLSDEEQGTLHEEVSARIPGAKAYSNWRDVGLHTFSLFSLGTSMVREEGRLLLTSDWVEEHTQPITPEADVAPRLRMPVLPDAGEEQLTPPAAPAGNDGSDAESFVAKVLRAQGWTVAFYTHRRGYGFDLWARKENRAMMIEVKSSLGNLGAVSLTANEYNAASEHSDSYVLALVDQLNSDSPRLRMIQNPVARLEIEERTATSYVIARAEWQRAVDEDT